MANYASQLSDAELDAAYDACAKIGDWASAQTYGSEIVVRLSSVAGFVGGLFGQNRFPLYQSWIGRAGATFTQAGAARQSVTVAAANVSTTITPTLTTIAIVAIGLIAYMVTRK